MTELGPLPEEWKVVPIGNLASVVSGGSAPQGDHYFGGNNPFVRVQHIEHGTDRITDWNLIIDQAVHDCGLRLFPKGTIVFPKSGASIYLEKRAVLPVNAYIVSHLCALSPKTEIVDGSFLFHVLRYIRFADLKAEGYPTLNLSEIKVRTLPLPPLPEQKAIAGVLSPIQRAIEAQDKTIASARELKKSLSRHLFTYGPVPLPQADKIPVKETEIGPLPEHWEVVRLGNLYDAQILKIQYGFPCGNHNDVGRGILHLRPMNINNDGQIELSSTKFVETEIDISKYLLQTGDIIFNNTNSEELVGKTAYWSEPLKSVLSNHMTIIRVLKTDTLSPSYLAKFMYRKWTENYYKLLCRRHVNQSSLSLDRLKQSMVSFPSISEQQEIARILSVVNRKIEAEQNRKTVLQTLFKTMLHLLMTGKVRVKDLEVSTS